MTATGSDGEIVLLEADGLEIVLMQPWGPDATWSHQFVQTVEKDGISRLDLKRGDLLHGEDADRPIVSLVDLQRFATEDRLLPFMTVLMMDESAFQIYLLKLANKAMSPRRSGSCPLSRPTAWA